MAVDFSGSRSSDQLEVLGFIMPRNGRMTNVTSAASAAAAHPRPSERDAAAIRVPRRCVSRWRRARTYRRPVTARSAPDNVSQMGVNQ